MCVRQNGHPNRPGVRAGKEGARRETAKLMDTANPEEKRKIIGDTFMRVSEEVIQVSMRGSLHYYALSCFRLEQN